MLYLVAALLALPSLTGFLHAFRTPGGATVAALEHRRSSHAYEHLVGV